MTDYFIGEDGDDANDGLSWANRKATFDNVEALVAAGDYVYVGPGTYRQTLTLEYNLSVSGIRYIGDVGGYKTDGIGGPVRITGSDDDETATRASGIIWGDVSYWRYFYGFTFDMFTSAGIDTNGYHYDHLFVIDCSFGPSPSGCHGIFLNETPAASQDFKIDQCFFNMGHVDGYCIYIYQSSTVYDVFSGAITNCIFLGAGGGIADTMISILRHNGWYISNCTFISYGKVGDNAAIYYFAGGIENGWVYNSVFMLCGISDNSSYQDRTIEDYNVYMDYDDSDHNRYITEGGNTVHRPANFAPPMLVDGFIMSPENIFTFNEWSDIQDLPSNSSAPDHDFYGVARPAADSQRTRGAIQYAKVERETTIVDTGDESVSLPNAMEHQILIPITGQQMKFAVKVYREANYAGTLPQMIVKQPGQADTTVTDVGAVSQFNSLNISLTPATTPPYVAVCLRSNNTASSGSYRAIFDTFSVK